MTECISKKEMAKDYRLPKYLLLNHISVFLIPNVDTREKIFIISRMAA